MHIDGTDIRSDAPQPGLCWITGASSGIGRALALRMADAGWTVIASARNERALLDLAEECASHRIVPAVLDIVVPDAVERLVERIEHEHGPIDIAVLNAGIHIPVRVAMLDPEDFRRLIEINLMGTVFCVAALLPRMRARRCGRIAVMGSVAGYRGLPTAAAYGMTKAGLINMTEALAPELARDGVRMQIINPGFVRTPLTDRNRFRMPFLIDADRAAALIFRGLSSKQFEIAFPGLFIALMKLFRLIPNRLALAIARRMLPPADASQ
jgi:NAD(P)-dependent dehydrogenase (short-subunit alcohol dehydrogenase family)